MTACLPGKKQEEKVISQAQQATQQVAAERLAADMSNVAQSLMASNNLDPNLIQNLSSTNLHTFKCTDGSNRVIAFIPTSRMAVLPKPMANRIRDQLKSQFSATSVPDEKEANSVIEGCGDQATLLAVNAPVLVLSGVSANQAQDSSDKSDIASVSMTACPSVNGKAVPGVIVKKTYKDGRASEPVVNCGTAASDLPQINLSNVSMPDWKSQLKGVVGADKSFRCVVKEGSNNCAPLTGSNAGIATECSAANQNVNVVSNPVYDASSNGFVTGPVTQGNCGKGWTGQKIARISKSQCNLTRSGMDGNTPSTKDSATLYDVDYVAVKCSRNEVLNIPAQCPTDPSNQFYAGYAQVDMKDPVLLEPQRSINGVKQQSIIATPSSPALDQATLDGIKAVAGSQNVYVPSVDLRNVTDPTPLTDPAKEQERLSDLFASALVRDMGPQRTVLTTLNHCNTESNQCTTSGQAGPPQHVVIIMDRSASMGATDLANKINVSPQIANGYSCKAGLSNLFNNPTEACKAAKQYVQQTYQPSSNAAAPKVFDFIGRDWAGAKGPTANTSTLYQTMEDSLTDRGKYKPYLQFALASGWDCSGRAKAGSNLKDPFPDDMFGTCSGAASCDSCPGECSPAKIGTIDPKAQRIEAAELILKSLARLKLNPGTKITLGSFLGDQASVQSTTFCSSDHMNSDGTCDLSLERQALTNLFTRPGDSKEFVKPITQQVVIPTQSPSPPSIMLVPDQRGESGRMTEAYSSWTAPANTVMTGRYHVNDENGDTAYEYATLKAIDQNGQPVPNANITIVDPQWSGGIKESAGQWFYAPAGQVITGRRHDDDENGTTYYRTSHVMYNGQVTKVTNNTNSLRIVEADSSTGGGRKACNKYGVQADHIHCTSNGAGIFYRTPENMVVVGRYHEGDENGDTVYQAGVITAPGACEVTTLPGDWKTFQQETAAGTFNQTGNYEYKDCQSFPRAKSLANQNTPAQTQSLAAKVFNVNFFNNFGSDVSIPDNIVQMAGTYHATGQIAYLPQNVTFNGIHPWDQSSPVPSDFITTDPRGSGSAAKTDVNLTFCASRRNLDGGATTSVPSSCHVCDVSDCSKLPAVTASSNWESYANAKVLGTANKSGDYEYRSCSTIEKEIGGGGCTSDPNGYQNQVDSGFHLFAPAYARVFQPTCPNGEMPLPTQTQTPPADSWVTDQDSDTYTFCMERRARQDWKTADQAKADGTFNDSSRGGVQDTDGYEFRSCTQASDCGMEGGECAYTSNDSSPECQAYQQCLSQNPAPSTATWITAVDKTVSSSYGDTYVSTYCTERVKKPNSSSDNADLVSCLDKCSGKVLSSTDIKSCQTATNLFTGVTAQNCSMIHMPTYINYSLDPKVPTIIQEVTRFVPASSTDEGALPVATGATVWGADYFGSTPLYSTMDAVLANADVQGDLNAHKSMAVIVLTDGVDTGDGTATTTSPCGNESTSFMSRLQAQDPKALLYYVSLKDDSGANTKCFTKLSNNLMKQSDFNDTTFDVPSFLQGISNGTGTSASGLAVNPTQFCTDNFGAPSVYADKAVPALSTGTVTGHGAPVCRPLEIVQ